MESQINQFNRIVQNDAYRKAEQYHNGIKYGEYYTLLKRIQRFLMKFDVTLTSLTNKLNSKSAEFTTEAN